jgi:Superfamily II DNA and RNA helicases
MSGSLHELLSRYLSPTFEQANSWSDGGNGGTQDWQRLIQMGDIQNVASDGTKKGVISHGTDRQTVFVSATIPQKNHFLKQCVQNQWTVREPFYVCASPGELIPPTLKHVYVVCDGMDQKMVGLVRAIHREVEKETVTTTSEGSDCVVRMIVFCEPQRPMEKMQNVLQRELSRRMMVNNSAAAYSNVVTSVLRYDDSTSTRVAAMETFRGSDTYLGGRLIEGSGGGGGGGDGADMNAKSGDIITDIPSTLKKQKELNILITSDLAARGLDIADITHVINYDLPRESDTYVHRGGRAGRLGRKGMVISIITNEQEFVLNRLANKLGLDMKCISRQQQRSSSTRKK